MIAKKKFYFFLHFVIFFYELKFQYFAQNTPISSIFLYPHKTNFFLFLSTIIFVKQMSYLSYFYHLSTYSHYLLLLLKLVIISISHEPFQNIPTQKIKQHRFFFFVYNTNKELNYKNILFDKRRLYDEIYRKTKRFF